MKQTSVLFQKPNHPLYSKILWSEVQNGKYAVVDPMDSSEIMYLTDQAYQIQVRVSMSCDTRLTVLARPYDVRENHTSQGSSSLEDDSLLNKKAPLSGYLKYARSHWQLSELMLDKDAGDTLVEPTAEMLKDLILKTGRQTHFQLGGKQTLPTWIEVGLNKLVEFLIKILKTQGSLILVKTMKGALFLLHRYLADPSAVRDSFLLGFSIGLSRSGIPRLIPREFRSALARGDTVVIRLVSTVLRTYSVFSAETERQTLETIRSPHPQVGSGPNEINSELLTEFRAFIQNNFWEEWIRYHVTNKLGQEGWDRLSNPTLTYDFSPDAMKGRMDPNIRPPEFEGQIHTCFQGGSGHRVFYPESSGPNLKMAWLGLGTDYAAWQQEYPDLTQSPIYQWIHHVGDEPTRRLWNDMKALLSHPNKSSVSFTDYMDDLSLGKLVCLVEPAGKVRTIAMVDSWTQRVMKPVHDWLMEILRCLPTDGTFAQEESVQSFADQFGKSKVWSVDLKSATDLIPCLMYETVLEGILDPITVKLWKRLLQERLFKLPARKLITREVAKLGSVKYRRGLPMGAMTHWASMALTHHAIVLFSAYKAGIKNLHAFEAYRVLGDDVAIGNEPTAVSYNVNCQGFQIPVSTNKTLAGRLFIFASQAFLEGTNVTPMTLSEELSIQTPAQRLERSLRAVQRGWLDWCDRSPAGLLRLMLGFPLWRSNMKSVSRLGKLSLPARAALATAFVVGGKIFHKYNLLRSEMSYALLPLKGSVQALSRCAVEPLMRVARQLHLTIAELELALVVHYLTKLQNKVRRSQRIFEANLAAAHEMEEMFNKYGHYCLKSEYPIRLVLAHYQSFYQPPEQLTVDAYRRQPGALVCWIIVTLTWMQRVLSKYKTVTPKVLMAAMKIVSIPPSGRMDDFHLRRYSLSWENLLRYSVIERWFCCSSRSPEDPTWKFTEVWAKLDHLRGSSLDLSHPALRDSATMWQILEEAGDLVKSLPSLPDFRLGRGAWVTPTVPTPWSFQQSWFAQFSGFTEISILAGSVIRIIPDDRLSKFNSREQHAWFEAFALDKRMAAFQEGLSESFAEQKAKLRRGNVNVSLRF